MPEANNEGLGNSTVRIGLLTHLVRHSPDLGVLVKVKTELRPSKKVKPTGLAVFSPLRLIRSVALVRKKIFFDEVALLAEQNAIPAPNAKNDQTSQLRIEALKTNPLLGDCQQDVTT